MGVKLSDKIKMICVCIIFPLMMFLTIAILVDLFFKLMKLNVNILISQSVANLLYIILMLPIYLKFRKKYKLVYKNYSIKSLLYMLPLSIGLSISLNIIINMLLPTTSSNEVSNALLEITNKCSLFISIVIVGIITPICEEIIFRGFMIEGLNIIFNKYIAIIITSLIFALVHGNIEQGIYAFIVGIFFGYIIMKYQNIIYTIVMHCSMNTVVAIFQNDLEKMQDIKSRIFMLLIAITLFFITIIRINLIKEEK